MAFGVFPDVSPSDAHAKRNAAGKIFAAGNDPVERRDSEKRDAKRIAGETFEKIAEEWLARLELGGRAEKTMKKTRWLIEFVTRRRLWRRFDCHAGRVELTCPPLDPSI